MNIEGDPEPCSGEPSPLPPVRGSTEKTRTLTDLPQNRRRVRTEGGRAEGGGGKPLGWTRSSLWKAQHRGTQTAETGKVLGMKRWRDASAPEFRW